MKFMFTLIETAMIEHLNELIQNIMLMIPILFESRKFGVQ